VRVVSDFDPTRDFSYYKTYRWAKVKESNPKDILAKDELLRKKVQYAVDKNLLMKGFNKLEEGEPDFVVFAHAGVRGRMNVFHHGPYRYHPWWGPYGGYSSVSYYKEGTLVIDIVDNTEKELSWRGLGSGVVRHYSDPNELQEDLDYLVAEMLKNFPPGSESK
jgi:hypothetical protein